MTVRRSRLALACLGPWLLVLAPGCASAGGSSGADSADAPGEERERDIARRKLHAAELELEHAQKTTVEDQAEKAGELALAKAELGQFDEQDAPARLAQERLALTRSKDELLEQEEELAQLELTYAEVDLADKTREIVLQRNHRRVERAKAELALAERELATLEQHTLPRERAKLALEVETKTNAVAAAGRGAALDVLAKEIAVAEARAELAKLEKDDEAEKKASGSAP